MTDLQQEYQDAIKRYHDLEVLVSQRIAGTSGAESNCPDELLKQHLAILKGYIRTLEERLKYE